MIGGGVRAGVALTQDPGQRLTCLVEIAQQRVKAKVALPRRRSTSFSLWLAIRCESKTNTTRCGLADKAGWAIALYL